MFPSLDVRALLLLLFCLFLLFFGRSFFFFSKKNPVFFFSRTHFLRLSNWRSRLSYYPEKFHWIAFGLFLIAWLDPHVFLSQSRRELKKAEVLDSVEGGAIYLVLDQSGSMASPVGTDKKKNRMDLLKEVTKDFIVQHPSDLIGIVSFARVPQVLVPLTLDQTALLQAVNDLQIVKKEEEDGTGIGYAIYKTAHLIAGTKYFLENMQEGMRPPYAIKNAVLILVTDGFQDPSLLDQGNRWRTIELEEAAHYAKSQGIHLYIINVDPQFSSPSFAPHRRQLEAITRLTGGEFNLVSNTEGLRQAYAKIDRLEKGWVERRFGGIEDKEQTPSPVRFSLYPFFLGIGLSFFLCAFVLETLIIKRVP